MASVGALIWFIGAIALAAIELMVGEMTFLMLAGGALATAGVALFSVPLWAEILVFSLVSIGLLVLVKPALKKRMLKAPVLDTTDKALVGKPAIVLEPINSHSGQIRLDGSIWSARSLDPTQTYSEGDKVQVFDVEGTTAIVWKER